MTASAIDPERVLGYNFPEVRWIAHVLSLNKAFNLDVSRKAALVIAADPQTGQRQCQYWIVFIGFIEQSVLTVCEGVRRKVNHLP
jgi:hypothetical protein